MVHTSEPKRKAQPTKLYQPWWQHVNLSAGKKNVASQLCFDIKNPQRVLKILAYKTEQQPQINQI